jgi:hypothetical protein
MIHILLSGRFSFLCAHSLVFLCLEELFKEHGRLEFLLLLGNMIRLKVVNVHKKTIEIYHRWYNQFIYYYSVI